MVVGSNVLEMVEHMFCAVGRPNGQEVVVGIQQSAAAPHSDESGVAFRREDYAGHSRLPSLGASRTRNVSHRVARRFGTLPFRAITESPTLIISGRVCRDRFWSGEGACAAS
jgi:hypothetical protein